VTSQVGRYELVARIATGGMGEIFLARLEGAAGFEKLYVIKRILPHLADDRRFRAMLIDEAQIAARMSHPNICQVFELNESSRLLYIVMEYLEGATLLMLLRAFAEQHSQTELGFVVGVIQQTADGLHYAHEFRDRSTAT
jgi:eukaryotic-like serine/threonine-protein kinase